MDLRRLRTGERIAAGAAVLLFIDMFLNWYGAPSLEGNGQEGITAWQAFAILDIFLLLGILVALGLAVLTATHRSVALPVAASVITAVVGALATLIVLIRILDQPGPNASTSVKFWAVVGLLLCAAIAYGGWRSMRDEGTSLGDARVQAERAVRGDDVPARPAPPPEPLGTPGDQESPPAAP